MTACPCAGWFSFLGRTGGTRRRRRPPAAAWVLAAWLSTALVVLGASGGREQLTGGAQRERRRPDDGRDGGRDAVPAPAVDHRVAERRTAGLCLDRQGCRPVTASSSRFGPVPETPGPSADNGNRASIFKARKSVLSSAAGGRNRAETGGPFPRALPRGRGRLRLDPGAPHRYRRRGGRSGVPNARRAGVHRQGRISTSRPGNSGRAPATACGCSRTRSRTWCSSPWAWSARGVRVMMVRVGVRVRSRFR